jgi:glycosyltransferase involved in cell wall biosynthesis
MSRICIISKSHLPFDPRVVREARALAKAGHQVDVICARSGSQPFRERDGAITIYRLPVTRRRGSVLRYAYEFVTFQLAAALLVGAIHVRRPYAVVETTSLPDWLVFATAIPRLFGARVLLDLHEVAPEYGMTKYKVGADHPSVRMLRLFERLSIGFADFVTTCSEQMRERFIERGAPAEKIDVVLNSFDEQRFPPDRVVTAPRFPAEFVLITHGTIEENYGTDLIVRAVALLRDRIPGLRLEVYGDGTHRRFCQELARELGVEQQVWFSDGFIPMEDLLPRIAAADAGVVAVRRDAFRDVTLCIKMFDFVTMRRPVIISRTRAVEAYFGDDAFELFGSGDAVDLARAIEALHSDPARRAALVARATERNEPYRWPHQERRYVEIVERLAARQPVRHEMLTNAVEEG